MGSRGFSLKESGTVSNVVKPTLGYEPDGEWSYSFIDDIDSPAKFLEVYLYSKAVSGPREMQGGRGATIFVAPDLPPVAIDNEDIRYVLKDKTFKEITRGIDYEDLRVISKVTTAFGPEALDYLSETACRQLISALQQASKCVSGPD